MATLQQAAALTAYQLRTSPEMGRRKVTAQMVRDLAEPAAVSYIQQHLEEYEDVPASVKVYLDVVVDAFRMDHGVLSQVEYDAHLQAYKDAERDTAEEADKIKRWGLHPTASETDVYYHANRRSIEYMIARYIPPSGGKLSEEDRSTIVKGVLQNQEAVGDQQEYQKQYVLSYKEWKANHNTSSLPESVEKTQQEQQKKWWQW